MHNRKPAYPIIAVVFTLLLGSISTFAHAGMEHVMGTVVSVTGDSIIVDTVKHSRVTVLVDPSTKFTNGEAPASIKNLKVGDRIVIHAKRNSDKKLIGVEVKSGTGSVPMDKMKGMDHKQ